VRDGGDAIGIDSVARKGAQGEDGFVATSNRLATAKGNDIWMRVMMLAPSVGASMSVTVLGDADLTRMRAYFVKPLAVVAITFSEDPMMGVSCDRFSGSAIPKLETTSFVLRTASLLR
jgi:hypothetical protein